MRRPDVFTLDYSHPLAQGLVFAGLAGRGARIDSIALDKKVATLNANCSAWVFDEQIQRHALDLSFVSGQDPSINIGLLPVTTGPNTLVFWSKHLRASGTGGFVVFGQQTGTYWQHFDATRFNVQTAAVTIPNTPIQSAAWRCWALTSAGPSGAKAVHINGVQVGTSTGAGGTPSGGASWQYAGWSSAVNWRHNGLLADPMFFNRVLSPAEIALLADRTDPMLGGLIVEERPVLYFDMGGSTVNDLTPQNIATDSPVITSPTIGQVHVLTAQGVAADAPTVTTATLGQIHVLGGDGVALGSPTITTPVLTVIDANTVVLTGLDIVSGSPDITSPAIGQVHALLGQDVIAGAPTITIEGEKVRRGGGGYTEAPAKAAKPTKQQARKKPTTPKVIEFTRETEAEKQAAVRRILTAPIVDEAPAPQVAPQVAKPDIPSPFLVPSPAQTIDPLVIREAADLLMQATPLDAPGAMQPQAIAAQEVERIAMMRMRDEDEAESLIMIFASV